MPLFIVVKQNRKKLKKTSHLKFQHSFFGFLADIVAWTHLMYFYKAFNYSSDMHFFIVCFLSLYQLYHKYFFMYVDPQYCFCFHCLYLVMCYCCIVGGEGQLLIVRTYDEGNDNVRFLLSTYYKLCIILYDHHRLYCLILIVTPKSII